MPSYFYHVKFELYPWPDSHTSAVDNTRRRDDIWNPPAGASVFDKLPSHARSAQRRARSDSASGSCHTAAGGVRDWRFGRVSIETADPTSSDGSMPNETVKEASSAAPALGPSFGGAGTATKAEYLPLETRNTELGWGVVHFYREGDETSSLKAREQTTEQSTKDEGSTLCIPAVPVYMSPGDVMGFIGERWMGEISHCRMVMTSRMNRYLVLVRFRDAKRAKQWKSEFDGKVFNAVEPLLCHVVFVKSITFETPTHSQRLEQSAPSGSASVSNTMKPFPPPTANLIELPTCPVCLERMDDTNGLMTIPCSHVFHCSCLRSWKGSGCPVCRFTNTAEGATLNPNNPYSQPFGSPISNLCSVCDCIDDLWICLICGYLGCGRYKGGHAKDHWKETAHSFALELDTQHVWDYAGDMWVHRLIRDKGDGKVVEFPGRSSGQEAADQDVVPRAKVDNMGLEYMQLLTSQLETQRVYYEDMIKKAVDKAAKASAVAESSAAESASAAERLSELESKHEVLNRETLPQLERELERERRRSIKAETLARNLGKSLQEEKGMNQGLVERIQHLTDQSEALRKQVEALKAEGVELRETNRDLSMFISGQEKLRELEQGGELQEGEIAEGSISLAERSIRKRPSKKK
ncbi:hypothetical protein CDD81_949 [Ophiocordyceps australis]|uniref:RING-type domain-containing protein n=1 Tax=Ophiocordyceps australis TaxID=1399860 RepID=A0A2C5YGI1_9HYPO|nr:hypothetical protein CDD81_949 [Ophiocordyceps australis]